LTKQKSYILTCIDQNAHAILPKFQFKTKIAQAIFHS